MTACQTCKYYLTYACHLRSPKCRVASPFFRLSGVGCPHYQPKL